MIGTAPSSPQQAQRQLKLKSSPLSSSQRPLQRIPRPARRVSLPNMDLNSSSTHSYFGSSRYRSRSRSSGKQRRLSAGQQQPVGEVTIQIHIPPLRRKIRRFSFRAKRSLSAGNLNVYVDPKSEKPGLRRLRRCKTHDGRLSASDQDVAALVMGRWDCDINPAPSQSPSRAAESLEGNASAPPRMPRRNSLSEQHRHPSLPDLNERQPPLRRPQRSNSNMKKSLSSSSLVNAALPKRSISRDSVPELCKAMANATFPKRTSSRDSVAALGKAKEEGLLLPPRTALPKSCECKAKKVNRHIVSCPKAA